MFAHAAVIFRNRMQNLGHRFVTDRAGNLALSFAIVSVPLLAAMGVSFDYVRALNLHREIQGNLDAALVATIKDIGTKDETELKKQLGDWLIAEADVTGSYELDTASIVIDKTGQAVTAMVKANVDTTFLRILGKKTVPVSVKASVIGGEEPGAEKDHSFSMYFVLDRSGSMDENTRTSYTGECEDWWGNKYKCTKYYKKMESLKMATTSLLVQIEAEDPEVKYARTGGVSYNNVMQSPTALAWGVNGISSYIKNLTSSGTTNSGEAFKEAYNALTKAPPNSEAEIHEKKNGISEPVKYIVFMTDGENNVSGADTKTKKYCDAARKADIKVYAIAFMAPTQGQNLLKYCATTTNDYYEAEDTAGLIAAFTEIGKAASKKIVRLTN
jgi:Flp pilus assembly protein TadG